MKNSIIYSFVLAVGLCTPVLAQTTGEATRSATNKPVAQPTTQQKVLYQTRELLCPSKTQGVHVQTRKVVNINGEIKPMTDWETATNTCKTYLVGAHYEYREGTCQEGYEGTVKERRSYELWSDGAKRSYSDWSPTVNTCIPIGSWRSGECRYDDNNYVAINAYLLGDPYERSIVYVKDGIAIDESILTAIRIIPTSKKGYTLGREIAFDYFPIMGGMEPKVKPIKEFNIESNDPWYIYELCKL